MATKKKNVKNGMGKKDVPVKLNMGFGDAMKKALSTPLPKGKKK
jgi:hypothetical protein